jgi:uncharacterized protein YgiM (DUF1202 family)
VAEVDENGNKMRMKKFISGLILLVIIAWASSLPQIQTVAQSPAPTYDPRPLCADRTGATTPIVRYDIPFGSVTSGGIYCRPLVQNGQYLVNAAQIGNQDVINLGISQAVDVFAILTNGTNVTAFNNPIKICLQGAGTLFFLDANQSPRPLQQLIGVSDGGYTCGSISTAGTMMLTNSAPAPVASTPVPGATPGATVAAPTGPVTAVSNCTVTTTRIVRLRAEANTTSKILARLPYNTSWKVTERVEGWYRVIWKDTQGWVSASFVQTSGSCS